MKQPVSFLTQSRFYSPEFNSAIFDGPFRIYFKQIDEPAALRIFFCLQKKFGENYAQAKSTYRTMQTHFFIMLYSSASELESAFIDAVGIKGVLQDRLGQDYVLGLCPDFSDEDLSDLIQIVANTIIEPTRSPVLEPVL